MYYVVVVVVVAAASVVVVASVANVFRNSRATIWLSESLGKSITFTV